jgi:hypothetical protein
VGTDEFCGKRKALLAQGMEIIDVIFKNHQFI